MTAGVGSGWDSILAVEKQPDVTTPEITMTATASALRVALLGECGVPPGAVISQPFDRGERTTMGRGRADLGFASVAG
jgi:hypothetical protein